MRIFLLTMLSLFIVVLAGSKSFACDCSTRSPDESFREADVVFEGQVVRITPTDQGTAYTFQVGRLLKGTPTREITLFQLNTDCDSEFGRDVIYKVFAKKFEERLSSGTCSGNQVLGMLKVNPPLRMVSKRSGMSQRRCWPNDISQTELMVFVRHVIQKSYW